MNGKRLTIICIVLLTLLLSMGATMAEDPQPAGEVSLTAVVNSRISYQGILKEAGSEVTGSRDMTFRLYADDACTAQVGSDIAKPGVQVVDGLFTVELDVAHNEFNGQGLWLGVEVGGTAIVCQEILPVPYALSLRPGASIVGEQAGSPVLLVENSSSANDSRAIRAYASAANGFTAGVNGRTDSSTTGAKGVWGYAAGGGQTYGVHGESNSTSGRGVYGRANTDSGTNYGVYGQSNSADGYGVYGVNTADGYAGYFEGDLAQSRTGDGLVKAGVYTTCGPSPAIDRSFNNVGGTISVSGAGGAGSCIIDFGFQVSDRFWVATAGSAAAHMVNCVPGAFANRITCYRRSDQGTGENGYIMVLVY
jgi:hypothetical protein